MRFHSQNNTPAPLNIAGSSTFGVYPKISLEKTYNQYISDNWLIDFPGYSAIATGLGMFGRGLFTSNVYNRMFAVIDNLLYIINVVYNPANVNPYQVNSTLVGMLLTFTTNVYFAENNAGQIAITDGSAIYIYNAAGTPTFQTLTSTDLGFIPGYITFHDTYFIAAATQDTFYSPPANNSWRLSAPNDGTMWPAEASTIGSLQTKPDTTAAVLRFPSRGNMILVLGENVGEFWFDQNATLFPYQRNTGSNIDYGTGNASTIASIDEVVFWLAQNERSGPFIVFTEGGMVEHVSTDGIDNLLQNLIAPFDSEASIFRINGHIFYNINFYTDNISLIYDYNLKKFYHLTDENGNYFIAKDVAFFNTNYYFVSKNDGNLYALSENFTKYNGKEIPRIRVCKSIRMPTQDYFIVSDVGFTIEMGTTEGFYNNVGPAYLITQDDRFLITQGNPILFLTQDGKYLLDQAGDNLASQQVDSTDFNFLVTNQDFFEGPIYPRVDMSISYDGAQSFGSYVPYNMNPLGKGRNMLRWWRCGLGNDVTFQFRFWGMGRFVATDGVVNVRQ